MKIYVLISVSGYCDGLEKIIVAASRNKAKIQKLKETKEGVELYRQEQLKMWRIADDELRDREDIFYKQNPQPNLTCPEKNNEWNEHINLYSSWRKTAWEECKTNAAIKFGVNKSFIPDFPDDLIEYMIEEHEEL